MRYLASLFVFFCVAFNPLASAAEPVSQKWVVSWTSAMQGPYPIGNPSEQPSLQLAFPSAEAGARDQSFRMVVKPEIWGREARVRLSNAFGAKPVTINGVFAGLHLTSSAIVEGTNRAVTFGTKDGVTILPGESVWSDPVRLPFVKIAAGAAAGLDLAGRKLAVSFHVVDESGPMTWHAKGLQTSYLTAPGAGSKGADENEAAFPFSTTSWFFLDAVDMKVPENAFAVVALGDSITDGALSTINGDDRWPDVLARRLHVAFGNRISVVNAGIGGNQILLPKEYSAQKPTSGGPSARERLERNVLSLSGVGAVIWLEGINDFSKNGNAGIDDIQEGMKETVARIRARFPGVRVIGATLPPALGSTNTNHGFPEQDEKRKVLNEFIRTGKLFDGVADFEKATLDPDTGGLKTEFVHNTTLSGPGDKLHPNRLGYIAMGTSIKLDLLLPATAKTASR